MEIKTLVIFGFVLVLASSGMFFYLNQDNLNKWAHQLNLFNATKKTEIAQIDSNIKQELKQPSEETPTLKQELTALLNKPSAAAASAEVTAARRAATGAATTASAVAAAAAAAAESAAAAAAAEASMPTRRNTGRSRRSRSGCWLRSGRPHSRR
jgi:hypothetical protein